MPAVKTINGEMIVFKAVKKIYNLGAEDVHALDGVDLNIERNEYISIMGPSGSGKSTLMNVIGCLKCSTRRSLRTCQNRA
jgi:putative ABC transport system ATP-binding protein